MFSGISNALWDDLALGKAFALCERHILGCTITISKKADDADFSTNLLRSMGFLPHDIVAPLLSQPFCFLTALPAHDFRLSGFD